MLKPDDTAPETPKAKTRLSLHQIVFLVDVLEYFSRQLSELRRQVYHIIVKYDRGNPTVYNQLADNLDKESRDIVNSFKDSLEEENDRPSQNIIVNVDTKKDSSMPKNPYMKFVYFISAAFAAGASIFLALKEAGILK